MNTAPKASDDMVPLYDLFDGLGRRRRLARSGHNPDELVRTRTHDISTVPSPYTEHSVEGEAAA